MLSGNFTVTIRNKGGDVTGVYRDKNTISRIGMGRGFLHTMAATPYTNGHSWFVGFMATLNTPVVPTVQFTKFTQITTFLPRLVFNPNSASGGGFTGSTTTFVVSWDVAVHTPFASLSFEGLFLTNDASGSGSNVTLWSAAPTQATIVVSNGDSVTVDYTCGSSLSTIVY